VSGLVPHLQDLWSTWQPVVARRMFGGHGLYAEGCMFGLVAGEVLYLKVDADNRSVFEAEGLPPFVYDRQGRAVALSFHRAPDAVLDDPAQAAFWAGLALAAARRAHAVRGGKSRSR
jgi:DNA transformation protein